MYALKKIIADLTEAIADVAQCDNNLVEVMPARSGIDADLSWPSFQIAKQLEKTPSKLAEFVHGNLKLPNGVKSAEVAGGYLNFQLDWSVFGELVIADFTSSKLYGHQQVGQGKTIVTDLSAPNIAKPFSVGHLRSTVIGDSINHHLRALGYTVIGDNHLGDWGTTFGKMIVAFREWGDRSIIENSDNPVAELTKLYVRFQETIKPSISKPQNEDEVVPADEEKLEEKIGDHPLMIKARHTALALEQGAAEETELWEWFIKLSLRTFKDIYKKLGVTFQEQLGESTYRDLIPETVEWLKGKGILKEEDGGAIIVPLPEMDVVDRYGNHFETPLMVLKTNGGSVYETRDLACALYRERRWHPEKIIYVVGAEQGPYFEKLFKALELAGLKSELIHTGFGMVLMKGSEGKWEKMSTRMGRVVLLDELLDQAVDKAREVIDRSGRSSRIDTESKEAIAQMIGIGAVKFNDLSQGRRKDIRFDLDSAVNLDGYSGPYLQYMAVRAKSLLRKDKVTTPVDASLLGEAERPLLLLLSQFPETIQKVAETFEPHHMAQYLFNLAQGFSSYYDGVNILKSKTQELKNTRLWLTSAVDQVLEEGLRLLGIETPEQM